MRPLAAAVVLLMLGGLLWASQPAPAPDAVEQALIALDATGWHSPEALLAFRVHGWGGPDHWSRSPEAIDVPPEDGDPATGLRAIHALYTGRPGPTGAVDAALRQRLLDNVPAVLESANDAIVSFQILAMEAAGMAAPELQDHLIGLAIHDGPVHSWGCGGPPALECTAFAIWALTSVDAEPRWTAPAATFILDHYDGGPYDDPTLGTSVQATAWSMLALAQVGAPVPPSGEWLAAQQHPGGLYLHAGRPDRWATADVLLMQGL